MRRDREAALIRTAESQYGLVNAAQLKAAGFTDGMIQRRVTAGRLNRVVPSVFGITGIPWSWECDLMTAHLWAGPGSAISFSSAAALWELSGFARRGCDISVVTNLRNAGLPFRVHRVRAELLQEIRTVDAIPVTSVPWTMLDIAWTAHHQAGRALDQALREGLTTLGELWLLVEREWTHRRRGVAIVRQMLVERTPDMATSESALEDLFWGIVRDFDLPHPVPQFPIVLGGKSRRIDFAYPEVMLAIECDGFATHGNREAWEADRVRDRQLKRLGWNIERFTWGMLKYDREEVAATVRGYLELSAQETSKISVF